MLPIAEDSQVTEYFSKLNPSKSMGLDAVEGAEGSGCYHYQITTCRLWQVKVIGEFPSDRKKIKSKKMCPSSSKPRSQEGRSEECQFHLRPKGRIWSKSSWKPCPRKWRERRDLLLHRFTKNKSCLTITLRWLAQSGCDSDEMTDYRGKWWMSFNDFNNSWHYNLVAKLGR